MKPIPPLRIFVSLIVISLAACRMSHAAVLIVDTFNQGGFTSSLPDTNPIIEEVSLPLGNYRQVAYGNPGLGINVTAANRTIDPVAGTLAFLISGTSSLPQYPPRLNLIYRSTEELNDISSYSELILGFRELTGVGTLYVELGGSDGLEGVFRVDLSGPGEVRYPVSAINANVGHTLDAFASIKFTFESRSDYFYFTLDEIRLVPEPSGTVLVLAAGGLLLTRRRRAVRED